jgi:hypothetical protein
MIVRMQARRLRYEIACKQAPTFGA